MKTACVIAIATICIVSQTTTPMFRKPSAAQLTAKNMLIVGGAALAGAQHERLCDAWYVAECVLKDHNYDKVSRFARLLMIGQVLTGTKTAGLSNCLSSDKLRDQTNSYTRQNLFGRRPKIKSGIIVSRQYHGKQALSFINTQNEQGFNVPFVQDVVTTDEGSIESALEEVFYTLTRLTECPKIVMEFSVDSARSRYWSSSNRSGVGLTERLKRDGPFLVEKRLFKLEKQIVDASDESASSQV